MGDRKDPFNLAEFLTAAAIAIATLATLRGLSEYVIKKTFPDAAAQAPAEPGARDR